MAKRTGNKPHRRHGVNAKTQAVEVGRSAMRSSAFLLVCALAMGGCSTRGGRIAYNVKDFGQPDAPKAVVVADAYKLAPLDTVTVSVFQVADLSRDYTIDLSGNMTMPLIGQVSAIGMSTTELATTLKHKLSERYLQDPNVTVALKDSASRVVTVEGSVHQPGVYSATGPLTLVQVVALAHGTDELANPRRVAIFRTIGGKRMAAAFDLISIRRGEMTDPPVYAGDTVVIDGSGLRRAQHELLQALPLSTIFFAVL